MSVAYIYKIVNPEGKVYIGRTDRHIQQRWREYRGMYKNIQKQKLLYRSLKKYGVENHKFEIVLRFNSDLLDIDKTETKFIEFFNSFYPENKGKGLNLVKYGSAPMKGRKHSAETLKKLSISAKGREVSFETRQKISQAHKGKITPIHVVKTLIQRNLGNKYGQGRVKGEQELEKMRIAHKKRISEGWVSPLIGRDRTEAGKKIKETKSQKSYKGLNQGMVRNDLRKHVVSYNLDGTVYREFDSLKDALIHFGKKPDSTSHITRGLRDNNKIVYNKKWKYACKDNINTQS